MDTRLRLLDGVAWRGADLPGSRPAALLAALAAHPAGLSDARLVTEVWGAEPPTHPTKALQVLTSRLRKVDPALVVRREGGYRLGLEDVDAWWVRDLLREAERRLADGDPARAAEAALQAQGVVVADAAEDGPLGDLRRDVARAQRAGRRVLALACARSGRDAEAMPLLAEVHEDQPDDVEVLAALLRVEMAEAGAPTALERYDRHRRDLADRLGVDPDPALQRVHVELLAADSPQRTGVRQDADELLGRADDLVRLRAAVAAGRLTTVLGPGGIGKTRIAHVLAREAAQPRVHVVELVGVGSGDDVVAEVGAALGIRGSVTRHTLTPAQEADVRSRISQELDSGPTLLVLDNCEHVLEAIAGLVAFLLVTTRDLRVLATSRAPLRIAAERVVPLTQLAAADAADLFVRRAAAVRPDARLDPEVVAAVVARLDGLPLAVELAAARIRTLSVEQVRAALDDRFDLLRSRDRTAPERHRTLTAVIAWSWDLLTEPERRAAAMMSVFHDGFDGRAARSVLGPGAADLVEALADQSIVTVDEAAGRTRFRMLETIREYAGLRLVESGRREEAEAAHTTWALGLAAEHTSVFFSRDQFTAVEVLLAEENNLTDALRRALTHGDAATTARLLSTLGSLWTLSGNHPRLFAVADATENLLADWDPGDDEGEREAAFETAALLLVHLGWLPGRDTSAIRAAMARWGEPRHPWARATQAMFLVQDDRDVPERIAALAADEPDPTSASMLLMWAAVTAENAGEVDAAAAYAERALDAEGLTPYAESALHATLSQLAMYVGDHHRAAHHAELAWPVLLRLHAYDDASALRYTAVISRLLDGDVEEAARTLAAAGDVPDGGQMGSRMLALAVRAEVMLARGEVAEGLALYDAAVREVQVEFPGWSGGATPWQLMARSAALAAHVWHAAPGPDRRADELRDLLLNGPPDDAATLAGLADLPLSGVLLAAIGAWGLRFGDRRCHDDAVRALAVANRWAYNQSLPSLSWPKLAALADETRPGRLDALQREYAERPGPDLVPDATALLRSFTSSG